MKTYGGVEILASAFLTSALDGMKCWASHSGRFTTEGTALGTHFIGGRVDPTAGPDIMEKRIISCPCQQSKSDYSVV
jgi:hypothetical protein